MELFDLNNSKLFYKLWRNKVIRLRIFYHLNIFYSHKFSREFSINEIKYYKWKEYLQDIIINDDEDGFYGNKLELPINIEKLSFKLFNQDIYRPGWLDLNLNLTSLNFGKKFNLKLYKGLIPETIKTLNLGDQFNQILKKDDLPSSITELILGSKWNQPLALNEFPINLLSITFGNDFNNGESLTTTTDTSTTSPPSFDITKLPSTLTSLKFNGSKFQQFIKPFEMENHFKNLEKLEFHSNYKWAPGVGSIPSTVKELFLGYDSRGKKDQSLPINCIPSSVTKLTLGDNLICPIEKGLIPSSVITLSLGSNNLLYKDSLPPSSSSSLTKLDLGLFYNREIPDGALLRKSIKSIIFSHDFNQELSDGLFPSSDDRDGGSSLTSLDLGYFCKRISKNVLPSTLKEIKFNRLFNYDYINDGAMPDSVESIQMVPSFNYKNIPKSLTKLVYINFEREFPKDFFRNSSILWNNLRILDLSETAFNRAIEANSLPINLQELKFGFKFNQNLYLEMFPPNLKLLQLGDSFNRVIEPDTLPDSLETLIILGTPKLTQDSIPPNLNSIFCTNTNTTFLKSLDYYYFWNFLKIKKSFP